MIFTKELLLKGLAGVSLCAGVAGVGIHIYKSGEVKITNPQKQLGLPVGCNLPIAGVTIPCVLTAENINNIKFEGKSDNQTNTASASLQISIPRADEKDIFHHGYKVTITATTSNITINRAEADGGNIVINTTNPVDFKIKQKENKTFSLEKVGKEEILAIKAGLKRKADGSGWTIDETKSGISIKHDGSTSPEKNKTKAPAQPGVIEGKIKAYGDADTNTYNQGLKFVIEDGDISLAAGGTITKLEQFETYEIKEESNAWVLVRKTKAIDEVKKVLGLPTGTSDCPESSGIFECSLGSAEKLKAVNFDGKTGEPTVSDSDYSNIKLKISKTTNVNKERFPHGHKFVLESNKEISALKIKPNTNTEFKIKKTTETNGNTSWTLKKAWTVEELAAKVGLTDCTTGDASTKECSFGESINVYESETVKVVGATFATQGKKITYQEEQDDYNQGIKFTVSENLTLQGGTGASGQAALSQISGTSASYQIKEVSGVWYLVKKNN